MARGGLSRVASHSIASRVPYLSSRTDRGWPVAACRGRGRRGSRAPRAPRPARRRRSSRQNPAPGAPAPTPSPKQPPKRSSRHRLPALRPLRETHVVSVRRDACRMRLGAAVSATHVVSVLVCAAAPSQGPWRPPPTPLRHTPRQDKSRQGAPSSEPATGPIGYSPARPRSRYSPQRLNETLDAHAAIPTAHSSHRLLSSPATRSAAALPTGSSGKARRW